MHGPDLATELATMHAAHLRWVTGTVNALTGDTVTLDVDGGLVQDVGYLDGYVPLVGDTVNAIAQDGRGMLILGSNNYPTTPPAAYVPGTPVVVAGTGFSTYDSVTSTWSATQVQSPTQTFASFYSGAALTALAGTELISLEVEVNRTTGGPPEFVLHNNASGTGTLAVYPGGLYSSGVNPPAGVATYMPLPLYWAELLTTGAALGVGIGGQVYSGTYAAAACNLRFSPI